MKKDKILVILPTKDRLDDFKIFAESWKKTTEGHSDVLVVVDAGDTAYDAMISEYGFMKEEVSAKPFLDLLNEAAVKYASEYQYISFMEDDCNFNTPWESIFINKLKELGRFGIVWGDDLLNHDYIVGLPFLNSDIIDVLGYMTPPEIKYLWADHFWKDIGAAIGSLHYFPEVVVEHRHYSTGKREKCAVSVEVDSKGQADFIGYNQIYKPNNFLKDIQKLRDAKS